MKQKTSNEIPFVIEKLIKIMNDRKLTKIAFAELIGFPEAKWNKISNGQQNLSVSDLSNIAEKLRLREIDIFTFPDIYVKSVEGDEKTKILIEFEVNRKDLVELGLQNRVFKIVDK